MSAADRPPPHEGQVVTVFRNRVREPARESYGIDVYYDEYSIAVGTTSYASAFTRSQSLHEEGHV